MGINHEIFFHYSSLVGTHTSELQVKVEVPELNAIKTILALEGANLLRRLSKNLVVNDDVDNSLMQHIKVDSLGGVRKNSLTPTATSLINSRRGSAIGFR